MDRTSVDNNNPVFFPKKSPQFTGSDYSTHSPAQYDYRFFFHGIYKMQSTKFINNIHLIPLISFNYRWIDSPDRIDNFDSSEKLIFKQEFRKIQHRIINFAENSHHPRTFV
jgi:hypothetical protein